MMNKNEKESSGDSHRSCENDVSLFELLESFPDDKTVETTHLSICRSIIPGRRFWDAARNLAFNEVKNTFILSTDKDDRLRLSSSFSMIKDPTNVFASPTVAFASFYLNKFEDPSIKKIPDESVIPSDEREVKMPNFEVLLTCVNEIEMKIVLDSRLTWKKSVVSRNLKVVSPMLTSSIASLDPLASTVMVLSEAIKTIKDLNLTTTDESGQLQEPIQ